MKFEFTRPWWLGGETEDQKLQRYIDANKKPDSTPTPVLDEQQAWLNNLAEENKFLVEGKQLTSQARNEQAFQASTDIKARVTLGTLTQASSKK